MKKASDNTTSSNEGAGIAHGTKKCRPLLAIIALIAIICIAAISYQALLPMASETDLDSGSGLSKEKTVTGANSELYAGVDLLDSEGNATTLADVINNKPAIVNFWTTWCPYCVEEMDDYQTLYEEYGGEVSFVMIDYADGQRESASKARAYIEKNGYTFPVYYASSQSALDTFNVVGFPTTDIIDADGDVVYGSSGRIDPDKIDALLATYAA